MSLSSTALKVTPIRKGNAGVMRHKTLVRLIRVHLSRMLL